MSCWMKVLQYFSVTNNIDQNLCRIYHHFVICVIVMVVVIVVVVTFFFLSFSCGGGGGGALVITISYDRSPMRVR